MLLASTANAIIVGFNVRPDGGRRVCQRSMWTWRMYRVIYDAIRGNPGRYEGHAGSQSFRKAVIGHAEVRQTYRSHSNRHHREYASSKTARSQRLPGSAYA